MGYDIEQVINDGVLEFHAVHVFSGEAVIEHNKWMSDHFGDDTFK
ncbi:MAG TPA: hypothetical protein VJQ25_11500 [Nitrospira sp.]|nr:hypothetical protein [Nitrospira sp.]